MLDKREVGSKEPNHLLEGYEPSDHVQKEIMSVELKFDNYDHQDYLTYKTPVSQNGTLMLPISLEDSLYISRIIVLILSIWITITSLYTGSTIQTTAIHGGIAAFTYCLLTWLLNMCLDQYSKMSVIADYNSGNSEKYNEFTVYEEV